jgi:hypothetical protein
VISRSLHRLISIGSVLASIAGAGCATTSHEPTMITVADKNVQSRWESEIVGLTESPLSHRVAPVRRDEIVREYWVKGTDGTWYQIGRTDWEAAGIGQPLEIRAALPERQGLGPSIFPCLGPDRRWRC